ncbi:hypothetical protein ACVWZW_004688 [Bradyrhizobium sp. F1.13.4]
MAAAGQAIILPKQAIFLWPAPRTHFVRIQARFMSETRLRLCPKVTLREERRERAPSTVLAQILQRLSAPGSLGAATGWESCLGRDLSIDNAVAAPEVACLHSAGRTEAPPLATTSRGIGHVIENLFSEDGRRIVICAGHHFGGVRCPVGFGDRQPCPRRSRHSSDGAAHHCRGRGTVCWRTATRIDLQYRNFAIDTGSYPTDVVDGVSRSLDEAVPPQSARPDPAPAKPLFQSEGGLGIDRRHDLIGALTPAPVFQHRQCLSSEG